jgi:hypothetical protein
MPLATPEQLDAIRSTLAEAIETYCKDLGQRRWFWGDGNAASLPSFLFPFQTGILLLGIQETKEAWTLTVGLEDDAPDDDPIQAAFEVPLLKQAASPAPSIGFDMLGDNVAQVFHTGMVSPEGKASDFFTAYDAEPAKWPVLHAAPGDRLLLCTLDLDIFLYPQAYQFFDTLADFADYVTWYRDETSTED